MESLDCQISKVVSHKPSKFNRAGIPYLIARTTSGATIKGEMRTAIVGETMRLWGEWKKQKPWNGAPQPDAFEFTSHEVVIAEGGDGIAQYLRNHVDLVGPVKADALVKAFGPDTLKILRETPERATEAEGITPEIAESIKSHFENDLRFDPAAYAELVGLFGGYKVPKKIINSLMRDFGSDAPQFVKDKPYELMAFPRLGWVTVDRFATASVGYPPEGVDRHKAAIVEALAKVSLDGHTYGSKPEIEAIAAGLINGRLTPASWEAAEDDGSIVSVPVGNFATGYALPKLATAEEGIAYGLARLSKTAWPLPYSLPGDGLLAGQLDALRLVEQCGVVIVAGPPGTGKTYTVTRTLAGLIAHGARSIKYVAPTGKAAKRAAELLQRALPGCTIEPSTIHRALGPVPSDAPEGIPRGEAKHGRGRDEFGFRHNEESPIEAEILVVDEASMVDTPLGANLLKAVAPGTRVIFVGDPNQLPSIGPGSVLRDMISAGVPTATLTEIQRNSGRIVKACHQILKGETPDPSPRLDLANGENWIHLEAPTPQDIANQIVALHESARKNGKYDPLWDMQVISPEKGKPGVGCDELNRRLSDLLNRYKVVDPEKVTEDDAGDRPRFERGDKVIRTKNGIADQMIADCDDPDATRFNWEGLTYGLRETDIVNGDMGIVRDIAQYGDNWYVIVQFRTPDRLIRLPYGDCKLEPAYAITCHKAQGSGFPYVICPVSDLFYKGLWTREMIYTMFSRAETILITVGSLAAIRSAVSRRTVNSRRTRLGSLLRPAFAPQDAAATAEELVHV